MNSSLQKNDGFPPRAPLLWLAPTSVGPAVGPDADRRLCLLPRGLSATNERTARLGLATRAILQTPGIWSAVRAVAEALLVRSVLTWGEVQTIIGMLGVPMIPRRAVHHVTCLSAQTPPVPRCRSAKRSLSEAYLDHCGGRPDILIHSLLQDDCVVIQRCQIRRFGFRCVLNRLP